MDMLRWDAEQTRRLRRRDAEDTTSIKPREIVLREAAFPTDPDKRFAGVFAALGNSEAKCATMLCLDLNPLGRFGIQRPYKEKTGHSWMPSKTSLLGYVELDVVPIGFLAAVDFIPDGSDTYKLGVRGTKAGLHFGHPIAKFS